MIVSRHEAVSFTPDTVLVGRLWGLDVADDTRKLAPRRETTTSTNRARSLTRPVNISLIFGEGLEEKFKINDVLTD